MSSSEHPLFPGYDPSAPGEPGSLYGLPHSPDQAAVVVIPVPWEVTVSYGAGTAEAPQAVMAASLQVDLHDMDYPDFWKAGIAMLPEDDAWRTRGQELRTQVEAWLEAGTLDEDTPMHHAVNQASTELKQWLTDKARHWLEQGKCVGVLGGDHSTPLGLMAACVQHHGPVGILQIDAHADLRPGYEGFTHSHAAIMHHALQLDGVHQLVQVGLRDVGSVEVAAAQAQPERVAWYTDRNLRRQQFGGRRWADLCTEIVAQLPQKVYISFDIDGLDPSLCPHTGTPVPGGLTVEEVFYLMDEVVQSGRQVVGFDLCEVGVSPTTEWDANVGARVLYRLAAVAARSQGRH